MKKIILILVMSFIAIASKAQKCDFSAIKFAKYAQSGQYTHFKTNMELWYLGFDSCWSYDFEVYNYQNDSSIPCESWEGATDVTFYEKGKYQMRLNVYNTCLGCDTTFTLEVSIHAFGNVGLTYQSSANDCRNYWFEQTDVKDSCVEYYHTIWKADNKLMNTLNDDEFENLTDSAIRVKYPTNTQNPLDTGDPSLRKFFFQFPDAGRYLVFIGYYKGCMEDIDTTMWTPLIVCKETNNIQPIILPADLKVIGYYDMSGRQVYYLQPNQIYIEVYNNGARRKILKRL